MDDEGELVVAFHRIVSGLPESVQYTHSLAGGTDVRGSFVIGGELISVNRFLLDALPLWMGVLVHKSIVFGVAFIGPYLLVRRGLGSGRLLALAMAAFHSVSHFRLHLVTFDNGMSWALLPLAAYIVAFRTRERHTLAGPPRSQSMRRCFQRLIRGYSHWSPRWPGPASSRAPTGDDSCPEPFWFSLSSAPTGSNPFMQ